MIPINVEEFPDIEGDELKELPTQGAFDASSWCYVGSLTMAEGLPVLLDRWSVTMSLIDRGA